MDRETHYRHTQIGWVVVLALSGAIAVLAAVMTGEGPGWVFAVIGGVLLLVGALFASLTVRVDSDRVLASFGVGLVRRSILLADVHSFRKVRNAWYYGWGARLIPGGWMFNAWGLSAVELVLRDGRRFRIGTNEPDALFGALERELGAPTELGPDELAPPSRKLVIGLSLGLGAVVLVGVGVLLVVESRPPTIVDGPTGLRVESALYSDEILDADIESVALLQQLPAIRSRTNGFAMGGKLRGSFELQDGREARLYVDADVPPFVEVRHVGGLLIFNAEEPARTRALEVRLRERLGAD